MKTSNYFTYSGAGRISVSRSVPRNTLAGYRLFKKLVPGTWLYERQYKFDQQAYRERYFREVLVPLNAREIYDTLCALTTPHEPVLLCWEDLTQPEQWCHRRMIAQWFEQELGVSVPEFVPAPVENTNQLEMIL